MLKALREDTNSIVSILEQYLEKGFKEEEEEIMVCLMILAQEFFTKQKGKEAPKILD